MAKGNQKSSASSGTRKKNARKAAQVAGEQPVAQNQKKTRKEKGKSKEPKVKVYIPPSKPKPIQPDPLETTSIAHQLPPDLFIILKAFGKKDVVTKGKALERLQSEWLDQYKESDQDGTLISTLSVMLPVWLHHLPPLLLHSTRRIRVLAVALQASFMRIPELREQIDLFLRQTGSREQVDSILGSWIMVAHDIERSVGALAIKTWDSSTSFRPEPGKIILDELLMDGLVEFLKRSFLDPLAVYADLYPVAPVAPPPPQKKGGKPQLQNVENTLRVRTEEEEESETDRKARFRVSAIGGLQWILDHIGEQALPSPIIELLSFKITWTALHHAEHSPFAHDAESFGFGQPAVRRSSWALVQKLLQKKREEVSKILNVLAHAILRSAWVEHDANVRATMWHPLLLFLKDFPSSWELCSASMPQSQKEDTDSEDSDIGEEEHVETPAPRSTSNPAYQEFLSFLSLGCYNSPQQGYPSVVIILSTIPSSILIAERKEPYLSDFFESFWAALEGRALTSIDRVSASTAFLSSLMECVVFLVRRLRRNYASFALEREEEAIQLSQRVVHEQMERVWQAISDGKLKIRAEAVGQSTAKSLLALQEIGEDLFSIAWKAISTSAQAQSKATEAAGPLLPIVKTLSAISSADSLLGTSTNSLIKNVVDSSLGRVESSVDDLQVNTDLGTIKANALALLSVLDTFGDFVIKDPTFANRLHVLLRDKALDFLRTLPAIELAYLKIQDDTEKISEVWHEILKSISRNPEMANSILTPLLDAASAGQLTSEFCSSEDGELDALVKDWVFASVNTNKFHQLPLTMRILQHPILFLSNQCVKDILVSLSSSLSSILHVALYDEGIDGFQLETCVDFVKITLNNRPLLLATLPTTLEVLTDVLTVGYLLPHSYPLGNEEFPAFSKAREVWGIWLQSAPKESVAQVRDQFLERLKDLLKDTSAKPSSGTVLITATSRIPSIKFNILTELFPSQSDLDQMLDHMPLGQIDPALAVTEYLILPKTQRIDTVIELNNFDQLGLSSYARIAIALLRFMLAHRQVARHNFWILRHVYTLQTVMEDCKKVGFENNAFLRETFDEYLDEILSNAQQLAAYLWSSSTDDGWSTNTVKAINDEAVPVQLGDSAKFVVNFVRHLSEHDTVQGARALHLVLQHIVRGCSTDVADAWVELARKIEKKAPCTCMAILTSISSFSPQSARLDRYRNELAANIFGIPSSKANTEGLDTVLRLAATAPHPDSDVVFLPQPRAVNVMRAFEGWIASDDDIDEELESAMTLIFYHFAPILQGVQGKHWDLIFDIIENNLETCSFQDDGTIVLMARTLRLVALLQDLVTTNKQLRAEWQERQNTIILSVKRLTEEKSLSYTSLPRSACRELVLDVLQDLPTNLMDENTLSNMCHLLTDSAPEVQIMAYKVLHEAAKKRTEHFVVEAAVDSDESVKAQLPDELIEIMQLPTNGDSSALGYLLAWMLAFDSFSNASVRVRTSYTEHLRTLDVVSEAFIPEVFGILNLYGGLPKAFKLDIWAVDYFHLEAYEIGTPFATEILAAHVYYRALLTVPSLIRAWVLDCKDRGLSLAIGTYTSNYFSPVIIRTELACVKSPEAIAELADDALTIKVNTLNEITASYLVDEHQLEIALKMPPDWPLHMVDVVDVKKVGVTDNVWRAWLLGIRKWSQNGHIVDALSLFKKNVAGHFEGQVECAICYSIISLVDYSLPRKPCKTCKNRFHSACLYKWFNTSHTSSCPLCRSDII